MENNLDSLIEELNSDYSIITKVKSDILDEMDFNSDDERLLCDSIITNLEASIADGIRSDKIVQLPLIGALRVDPVKKQFIDYKPNLSAIRKSLSKEQYKEHVRDYIVALKEEQEKIDRYKTVIAKIKRRNRIKYDNFVKRFGKSYAELYLKSLYWLKEIPFDIEWEEHYAKLKEQDELGQ